MTIDDIKMVWLYAYSPNSSTPQAAFHTVFVAASGEQRTHGRAVLAQTSLSYLTTLSGWGAGALVSGYTPPFGPPSVTKDFKDNALFAPNAIAVTFQLQAYAAEAYSAGIVYLL